MLCYGPLLGEVRKPPFKPKVVGSIPTAPTKISQILLPFRTSAFLPSCACQAKRLHASNGDAPGRRSLPPMSVSYHVAVGWQRETRYPH